MEYSADIQATLRTFHLDNPQSTWPELKAKLREITESILQTSVRLEELGGMEFVYEEQLEHLNLIGKTAGMSVDQWHAFEVSKRILKAALSRTRSGETGALKGIYEELSPEVSSQAVAKAESPKAEPLHFEEIGGLFLKDKKPHVKDSTFINLQSTINTISAYMGTTDMRTHNRGDLIDLRDYLLLERKPSTVNRILTTLSDALDFAVNSGLIEKAWDAKLKLTKGIDSEREAFTQDQVRTLVTKVREFGEDSQERWVASLAAVTGARIGELYQLTKSDVRQVGDHWVLDFNENEGKTLKNRYSARIVPLIDGAHGFDLQGFLGFVERIKDRDNLFTLGYAWFAVKMNQSVRAVLEIPEGNKELSFHSLRHSMASLMKSKGIQLGAAQAILGHSSRSITYDLYGGDETLEIARMVEALETSFS